MRTNSAPSSKCVGAFICFSEAVLDFDPQYPLQTFLAINNNNFITIRIPLIFHKQIHQKLGIKFNYNILQI